ncbi:hypothetical protein EMCRGX_G012383 [Ephydatia muelleri]
MYCRTQERIAPYSGFIVMSALGMPRKANKRKRTPEDDDSPRKGRSVSLSATVLDLLRMSTMATSSWIVERSRTSRLSFHLSLEDFRQAPPIGPHRATRSKSYLG